MRRLAAAAGLNPRTLAHYFDRGSEPPASALIALARAGGVSLDWLLTGEGPRGRGAEPDETRMERLLAATIAIIRERGAPGSPEAAVKFARAVAAFWKETGRLPTAQDVGAPMAAPKSKLAQFFERVQAEAPERFEDAAGVPLSALSLRGQATAVALVALEALENEWYRGLFAGEVVDLGRQRRESALIKRLHSRRK